MIELPSPLDPTKSAKESSCTNCVAVGTAYPSTFVGGAATIDVVGLCSLCRSGTS